MTVIQIHFERHQSFIRKLVDDKLIYGLGISLKNPTEEFISLVKTYPNAVIHVINGIVHPVQLEALANNGFKILILGYKELRRGEVMYQYQSVAIEALKQRLYARLPQIIRDGWFDVVSFDNLAIKQFDVKRLMSEEDWEEFYMGDDGNYTFYIDMVDGTFGKNSLATERYPIMDDIDLMFQKILSSK